ncbi:hypothetical protein [Actinoplanes sp. NPDC051851]|uniref:hypothetical protein n=1 Tax=Actinoplanes sp. NPDC051851 TaxID=3154753 RepID=UPI00342CFE6C
MTRTRGLLTALPLLLLAACAQPGTSAGSAGSAGTADPVTESASAASAPAVLRVEKRGGFVPAQYLLGRLPLVSVYADGRVITEGPVPAIAPGPAQPNVQVQRVTPELVQQWITEATAAGVKTGAEFGSPNIADAPNTRVTLVTGGTTQSVEVVALSEAQPEDETLTAAQRAARKKLNAFVEKLTAYSTDSPTKVEAYRPTSVVALASTYNDPGDGLTGADVAWPGPALPGEIMNDATGIGCVAVTGTEATTVWDAAAEANQRTPWVSGGKKYQITFRPMLPDETDGCTTLRTSAG